MTYLNESGEIKPNESVFRSQALLRSESSQAEAKKEALRVINLHGANVGHNPIKDDALVDLMYIRHTSGSWKMLLTTVFPESRYYEVIHLIGRKDIPATTRLHVSDMGPIVFYEEGEASNV